MPDLPHGVLERRLYVCAMCGGESQIVEAAAACAALGAPPILPRGCIVTDYEDYGMLLLQVVWALRAAEGHAYWPAYCTFRDGPGPPVGPHAAGDSGPEGPRTSGPTLSAESHGHATLAVDPTSPRYHRAWAAFDAVGVSLTVLQDGVPVPAPAPAP